MTKRNGPLGALDDNPLWYKDAVIYELHVRSFYDSNGDGVGDFPGLTQKLDYLKDLGVTAIWLLPFFPSPLKDDGYDIADFMDVNPAYGTLKDFKDFLQGAHSRGLRVIGELVLNHTSDQHAWFQKARRAKKGSPARDFYVWSDTPEKYQDARIIFQDFEASNWTWDKEAQAYYWHRFYSHQPDLNYDNPAVRRAMKKVVDFWFELGVDGLRLDAVPYLYERQGSDCENLPETHAALKDLRKHIDSKFKNRMLLAEANQWPEDAISYFGEGDECHMNFHFPLMPRLFMAGHMEDRFPIIDILHQTPPIPETCQWAIFLRNHDELTLEMVTDEDRDYMVKVYAQDPQARINLGIRRRLAPLLGNLRLKIELMNGLLFALPGSPVLYYGDEIGMGDNIYLGDRNGVRTPMQWSPDRNAGFSKANPQRLFLPAIIDPEYHYESINVESQQKNPHSLLWWMKRMIALRKRTKAFSCGSIEFLHPVNRKVLVFLREHGEEKILVVANLSRFVQFVQLDLRGMNGCTPVEMLGGQAFPKIGDLPYFFTAGPHSFYWFRLEKGAVGEGSERAPTVIDVEDEDELFQGELRESLELLLPGHLRRQRWFGGKARNQRAVRIADVIPLPPLRPAPKPAKGEPQVPAGRAFLAFVEVHYTEGNPDFYALPLASVYGQPGQDILRWHKDTMIARLRKNGMMGVLHDALGDPDVGTFLLDMIFRRRRLKGESGAVSGRSLPSLRRLPAPDSREAEPVRVLRGEQSNTSIVFGESMILKAYRGLGEGESPELEIGRFLTEKAKFPHSPPVAGMLLYRAGDGSEMTLGLLKGFVPNEGDAWSFTLDAIGGYFETVLSRGPENALKKGEDLAELMGSYIESARLLGRRTAELHTALASDRSDPAFKPEPESDLYRKSLYHGMVASSEESLRLLKSRLGDLPKDALEEAARVLDLSGKTSRFFHPIRTKGIRSWRMRCHGDYHLGQVLYTGKDFVIIDFEGEPARSLSSRRIKRSPLRDVAGMLRSFHYAAFAARIGAAGGSSLRPEDLASLSPWAESWSRRVGSEFLAAYFSEAEAGSFLPDKAEHRDTLLRVHLWEKVMYELAYELNHRPAWVSIPLRGILDLAGD